MPVESENNYSSQRFRLPFFFQENIAQKATKNAKMQWQNVSNRFRSVNATLPLLRLFKQWFAIAYYQTVYIIEQAEILHDS